MPVTWLVTMPQSWPIEVEVTPADGRVRFEPDVGPLRLFRETTADPIHHKVPPMVISEAQRIAFDTWWDVTLAGGVRRIQWSEPWQGAGLRVFRFLTRPVYQYRSNRVTVPSAYLAGSSNPQALLVMIMELEELPWYPPE